jgi:hypothetical protein
MADGYERTVIVRQRKTIDQTRVGQSGVMKMRFASQAESKRRSATRKVRQKGIESRSFGGLNQRPCTRLSTPAFCLLLWVLPKQHHRSLKLRCERPIRSREETNPFTCDFSASPAEPPRVRNPPRCYAVSVWSPGSALQEKRLSFLFRLAVSISVPLRL